MRIFIYNACDGARPVTREVVSTLIRFNAIMAAFHSGIGPSATMVIYDLFLPISHRLQGAFNRLMLQQISQLTPTVKAMYGDFDTRRVVVPRRKRFFPFPSLAEHGGVVQQFIQRLFARGRHELCLRIQQSMIRVEVGSGPWRTCALDCFSYRLQSFDDVAVNMKTVCNSNRLGSFP